MQTYFNYGVLQAFVFCAYREVYIGQMLARCMINKYLGMPKYFTILKGAIVPQGQSAVITYAAVPTITYNGL